jgi:hypothetical protein
MVQTLSRQAGLPMPKVYIIPKEAPNAFATGRNPDNAVVAVTQGLLTLMNRQEIMGVLAHELAHVKNRDILIGTIAATMAGAIMMLASMARWSAIFGGGHRDDNNGGGMGAIGMIAMSIIAPMAAMIIQMAVSRSRGNTWPTPPAPASPAARRGWPGPWKSWAAMPGASPWMPTPRRPTCSSSIHCPEKACRACSPRIRRWRNASAGFVACGPAAAGWRRRHRPRAAIGGKQPAGRFGINLKGE